MSKHGVEAGLLRFVDRDIACGVYPEMTEHRGATDAWPQTYGVWTNTDTAGHPQRRNGWVSDPKVQYSGWDVMCA